MKDVERIVDIICEFNGKPYCGDHRDCQSLAKALISAGLGFQDSQKLEYDTVYEHAKKIGIDIGRRMEYKPLSKLKVDVGELEKIIDKVAFQGLDAKNYGLNKEEIAEAIYSYIKSLEEKP